MVDIRSDEMSHDCWSRFDKNREGKWIKKLCSWVCSGDDLLSEARKREECWSDVYWMRSFFDKKNLKGAFFTPNASASETIITSNTRCGWNSGWFEKVSGSHRQTNTDRWTPVWFVSSLWLYLAKVTRSRMNPAESSNWYLNSSITASSRIYGTSTSLAYQAHRVFCY